MRQRKKVHLPLTSIAVAGGCREGRAHFRGRAYDCYASRPDGEGLDYHCSDFHNDRLIDFGAGRRF